MSIDDVNTFEQLCTQLQNEISTVPAGDVNAARQSLQRAQAIEAQIDDLCGRNVITPEITKRWKEITISVSRLATAVLVSSLESRSRELEALALAFQETSAKVNKAASTLRLDKARAVAANLPGIAASAKNLVQN